MSVLEELADYQSALEAIGWEAIDPNNLSKEARHDLSVFDSLSELSQDLGDDLHRGIIAKNKADIAREIEKSFDFILYFKPADADEHYVLRTMKEPNGRVLCWATGSGKNVKIWIDELAAERANRRSLSEFSEFSGWDESESSEYFIAVSPILLPEPNQRSRGMTLGYYNTDKIDALSGLSLSADFFVHTSMRPK